MYTTIRAYKCTSECYYNKLFSFFIECVSFSTEHILIVSDEIYVKYLSIDYNNTRYSESLKPCNAFILYYIQSGSASNFLKYLYIGVLYCSITFF